jgi:molybdenum cofactor synthesis domain-containing protein
MHASEEHKLSEGLTSQTEEMDHLEINVEIFAIGSELCFGRVYDTNSFWIANQMTQLGATVQRIACVRDRVEDICSVVGEALNRRPHFIVLTGGLGPTRDDLTIVSLSRLLDIEIVAQKGILEAIARRKGVEVSDLRSSQIRMARSLKGAECLPNPVGSAPLTIFNRDETTIVLLPGPPREMKACFTSHVLTRVRERTRYQSVAQRIIVKKYESEISEKTEMIMSSIPGVYLKPLVAQYKRERGLPIDIVAFAESKESCMRKLSEAITQLRKSENNEEFEIADCASSE